MSERLDGGRGAAFIGDLPYGEGAGSFADDWREHEIADPTVQEVVSILQRMIGDDEMTAARKENLIETISYHCSFMIDWRNVSVGDITACVSAMNLFETVSMVRRNLDGPDDVDNEYRNDTTLTIMTEHVPADVIRSLYYDSDYPAARCALRESLEIMVEQDYPADAMELLVKIYGSREAVYELAEKQDPVVDRLRMKETVVSRELDMLSREPAPLEWQADKQAYELYLKDRSLVILRDSIGLNPWLAERQSREIARYAASVPPDAQFYPEQANNCAVRSIEDIRANVNEVGIDEINKIDEEFGLTDLRKYSPDDLVMLRALLKTSPDNKDRLKYLREGDVTCVLSETEGDHNWAMSETFDEFRDRSGRSLMLEVSEPDRMCSKLLKLKRMGIRPSTIVIAYHGSAGRLVYGGGAIGVEGGADTPKGGSIGLAELAAAPLNKLVTECMQPAKHGKARGRRTIILTQCCGDAIDTAVGVEQSFAESVVRRIGREDVDVYSSDGIVIVESSPVDGKVRFMNPTEKSCYPNMVKLSCKILENGGIEVYRETPQYVYDPSANTLQDERKKAV